MAGISIIVEMAVLLAAHFNLSYFNGMDQFFSFFTDARFMPHGHCYFWQPDVLWPNVIGDAVTAVSYFAIPFLLTTFVRRRDDLKFTIIFWAFALFITACGITHLFAVISVWHPIYYIEGYMKLLTGAISFFTVVLLASKFSELLAVPSTEQLAVANRALQEEIQERKETEAALLAKQREFNSIIRNAPIGKAILDLNGNWKDVNNKLTQMFGYTREEMLQTNFQSLTYEEDLPQDMKVIEHLLAGEVESTEFEKRYYDKEGNVWYGLVSATLAGDEIGGKQFFIAQIVDITERKNREKRELELKEELERQVAERTQELAEANQDLKNFVYVLGHDLRAPLSNLHQLADMVKEELEAEVGATHSATHALSLISSNAANLSKMMKELLAFSMAGKQELVREMIDMEKLTREAYEELLLSLPAEQDASLELAAMPQAYGDLSAIKQVLHNLISNGLKYSARREKSIIEVGGEIREGSSVFWVKDNGIGFDEKHKKQLFALFQRLHSSQEYEGTGVGLAICHRIIRKHEGRIWAESKMEEGATFYFELPLTKHRQ